jgi:hypothetical protein
MKADAGFKIQDPRRRLTFLTAMDLASCILHRHPLASELRLVPRGLST